MLKIKTKEKLIILTGFLILLGTFLLQRNFSKEKSPRLNPPKKQITLSALNGGSNLERFEKNTDGKSIPIILEGHTNVTGHHPSHICKYVLYLSSKNKENPEEKDIAKLNSALSWIIENKIEKDDFITWKLNMDLNAFNVRAPWTSALTNAWCAGALLQGYSITNKEIYEINAKKAMEYLFTQLEEGGGLYLWDDGGVWFEEVPNNKDPSHILNGHIYICLRYY